MPEQMTLPQHQENFKNMGVAIPAAQLSDPLAEPLAAVVLSRGCSAAFVSPEGLVITNHHCVQFALQHNSNEQQNLIEDGYFAEDRAHEIHAGPAQRIKVARAIRDVTSAMRDGLEKISDPVKRKQESEQRSKALLAECEKGRPGIKCSLASFYNGSQYRLTEFLEIRDLRIVYVPQRSVGNYGGEIDNWAWPRHTGDFAFYRAYVGPDGSSADYSPDNVPYRSAQFLKVATTGLEPGDFTMVVGYPGRTKRTATVTQIQHEVEWLYPYLIAFLKER